MHRSPALRFEAAAFLSLFLFSLFAQHYLSAQQRRLNVAVLDFDAREGLSSGEASTLSDVLQSHIVDMDEFVVVDRARIRQILEEQGFQQSEACSQVECIVEAGKILNVQQMIAGTIGKIGTLYNINVQVVDVATAQITVNKSRQHSGDLEEVVQEILPELSNEVAEGILGRPPKNLAEVSGGVGWFWYLLGTVVVGGGAAAVGLMLTKASDEEPPAATTRDLPNPPVLP